MTPMDTAERTRTDELLAAAEELVAHLKHLNTASALPGEESMVWHDHHEEAIEVTRWIANGLALIEVPE